MAGVTKEPYPQKILIIDFKLLLWLWEKITKDVVNMIYVMVMIHHYINMQHQYIFKQGLKKIRLMRGATSSAYTYMFVIYDLRI